MTSLHSRFNVSNLILRVNFSTKLKGTHEKILVRVRGNDFNYVGLPQSNTILYGEKIVLVPTFRSREKYKQSTRDGRHIS